VDSEQLFSLDDDYLQVAMGQIDVADIVLLNKVDRVPPEKLAEIKSKIADMIPDVRLLETTYGRVPLEMIIGVGAYAPEKVAKRDVQDIHVHEEGEHNHEHTDHSLVFETWSWTSDEPLLINAVREMVDQLPATIFRCKGVLNLTDFSERRAILQVVGRRASLLLGDPWGDIQPSNQIVVIAAHGGLDSAALRARFEACAVSRVESAKSSLENDSMEWERSDYYDI
jgi:G3E family GTPase